MPERRHAGDRDVGGRRRARAAGRHRHRHRDRRRTCSSGSSSRSTRPRTSGSGPGSGWRPCTGSSRSRAGGSTSTPSRGSARRSRVLTARRRTARATAVRSRIARAPTARRQRDHPAVRGRGRRAVAGRAASWPAPATRVLSARARRRGAGDRRAPRRARRRARDRHVMPGMSGPELAERIVVDGRPRTLFISGYSAEALRGRGEPAAGQRVPGEAVRPGVAAARAARPARRGVVAAYWTPGWATARTREKSPALRSSSVIQT